MSYVLEVKGMTTRFTTKKGPLTVVDRVSFNVEKGEVLGIVGESGCGKSVTSLSVMRLLGKNGEVSEGEVLFKGEDLADFSEKEMRKVRGNGISMIFQNPMTSLNPLLKIGLQIGEVLEKHKNVKGAELKKQVIDLLELVEIPRADAIYDEYPHQLSGGMKQRVMIALAVACYPALLIADEPTTALDVTIQAQILDLLKSLRQEFEMAILLITHDLGVVAEMCDRVAVMYAGQVVETTDTRTLLRNPQHPYTVGLIESTPQQSKGGNHLKSIPGQVPTPDQFAKGCRFSDRCPKVMEKCYNNPPPFVDIDGKTSSRCWLHVGKEETIDDNAVTASK